ncbi:MAG TPA: 30S ribosomal protein S6 [Clostridia bacterium]|nr:30S ribosomal protein S6 [Clostridia bacterium]
MANVTGKYESVIILKANLGDEATAALVERFKSLVSSNGTLDSIDEWGKRRLAYPISDEMDGYYFLMTFTADKDFPAEFDRQLKITDGVLRSLIISKDK